MAISVEKVKALVEKYHVDTIDNRRHLHKNPELSFVEYETSKFVQQKLTDYQVSFQNGIADTGIVGLIEGRNPSKKVVALRADMDALPIREANDVPYKSEKDGVMHACGHDSHTASLLTASRILQELRHEWEGTVKLIFQPGEEKYPGGASLMIEEGVLKNPMPVSVIGQHVETQLPAGMAGFCGGMMMASTNEIEITIKGKGGHGAKPHQCIDPVLISAHVLVALQQVNSRFVDPTIPNVLTFGKIASVGGIHNVIPNEVRIYGTLRMMSEEWRAKAQERIRQIATGVSQAMGGDAEVLIRDGYPFLINDEALTDRCRQAAEDYLGKDKVVPIAPFMAAEDFASYSQQPNIKGCFYRFGVRNEARGITSGVHTPTFDLDESALKVSVGIMTWLALQELAN